MPDEMFFTNNEKSLRRGRRREKRTETCRPCLFWPAKDAADRMQGVVMDLSPYGLRIRALEGLPIGIKVHIQLMQDETFEAPLSEPFEARIVRLAPTETGFTDHGLEILRAEAVPEDGGYVRPLVRQPQPYRSRPSARPSRQPQRPRSGLASRMHTIDLTIEDEG